MGLSSSLAPTNPDNQLKAPMITSKAVEGHIPSVLNQPG